MNKLRQKVLMMHPTPNKSRVSKEILDDYGLSDVTLRDYQVEGVRWLVGCYHGKYGCILGDEMGLGKTCQTISLLVYLHGSGESSGPHLILSPLSVLNNWKNELARFAPKLRVMAYVGNKEERADLQNRMKGEDFNVIISTYEICLKDESILRRLQWHTLVVDEGHRLKNRNSMLHQALLNFTFLHRVLLTGTPVQNNLSELYSLLCFVEPSIFPEVHTEEFIETYHHLQNTDLCVSPGKMPSELHTILRPFLLRRIKSDVLKDLPRKSEVVIYHRLSSLQKKYYKAILTKDTDAFENSQKVNKTRLMNVLMQLRKCVNHPYLFDGVEPEPFMLGEHLVEASHKLVLLDQLLTFLKDNGHKVLIFSQMTRMLDILQDYLGYRGYSYERLDGSVRGEERYLAVQNFNEDDSTFIFLLSTKAGGVGLNLTGADTVIFIDSDFNPQNDLQAAARAHRIGQTRDVKIIRLIGRNTVEEIILARAEAKLRLTSAVIEAGQFTTEGATDKASLIAEDSTELADVLKFGVDKLFSDNDESLDRVNFAAILGSTVDNEWQTERSQDPESMESASMDIDEAGPSAGPSQNMYLFEGTDYSKEPTSSDRKAFSQLIEAEKTLTEEEGKSLRKTKTSQNVAAILTELPSTRQRKKLTPEQLEERKQKRAETMERRAKAAEAEEKRKEMLRHERRAALWKKHSYTTQNLGLDSEGESDSDSESATSDVCDIGYVVGDVTHPKKTNAAPAFIVHCVDDSGRWGSGGLFSALDALSMNAEEGYTKAGDMKDLALGDCHLIAMDTDSDAGACVSASSHYVALVVAQSRDKHHKLSGIHLSALDTALQRIRKAALLMKASVHLPRIGHNTPGFNWYGTERLIRKHLAAVGVPTFIYYFPRKRGRGQNGTSTTPVVKKRRLSESDQDVSNDDEKEEEEEEEEDGGDQAASESTHPTQTEEMMSKLPDYFSSVTAYFHDIQTQVMKKYKRYIIAYNGDVQSSMSSAATHIITQPDCDYDSPDVSHARARCPNAVLVSLTWVENCINRKRLLPTEPYLIQR